MIRNTLSAYEVKVRMQLDNHMCISWIVSRLMVLDWMISAQGINLLMRYMHTLQVFL